MLQSYVNIKDYIKLLEKGTKSILTYHTIYGKFYVFLN